MYNFKIQKVMRLLRPHFKAEYTVINVAHNITSMEILRMTNNSIFNYTMILRNRELN